MRLLGDLRFAISSLARHPGQSLMAAAILALVIGANTAIFRLGYGILVKPIEAADLGSLVEISAPPRVFDAPEVPIPVFQTWQRETRAFSSLAAYRPLQMDLTGDGEPAKLTVYGVTPQLMQTLGGKTALGRPFSPDDVQGKSEAVVLLSHRLWIRRYGQSADVIGRTLPLAGKNYRVVGVLSAGLRFPVDSDAWVPIVYGPRERESVRRQVLTVIGRLAPGISSEAALTELSSVHSRLKRQFPRMEQTATVVVRPLVDAIVGPTRTALRAISGGAYFVLIVGALNVALLLFARNVSRRKEVATRFALGAGRGVVVRMLLAEAILLALAGAILGLAVGFWTTDIARSLLGALGDLPGIGSTGAMVTSMLYTVLLAVLVGVLFGIAPAVQLSFVDLNEVLRESGTGQAAVGRARWVRDGLLAGQVCLASLLVFAAGSFMYDLNRVQAHKGFDADSTLVARVEISQNRWRLEQLAAQNEKTVKALQALPQVASAALVSPEPYGAETISEVVTVEGQPPPTDADSAPVAHSRIISAAFFSTLKIPVRQGRPFNDGDRLGAPLVVIVSQSLARKFLAGRPPLDRRVRLCLPAETEQTCPWRAIVGVVGDVEGSPGAGPMPTVYTPSLQRPTRNAAFVVRTRGNPEHQIANVRNALYAARPGQPISSLQTYEEQISSRMSRWRILSYVTAGFGLLALLIAAVGINGATAHLAARRTYEVGVRMAIGATRVSIFVMVLGSSVKIIAAGIAAGLVTIVALSQVLDSTALNASSLNPLLILGTCAAVVLTAVMAAFTPALRVSRVTPCWALRQG